MTDRVRIRMAGLLVLLLVSLDAIAVTVLEYPEGSEITTGYRRGAQSAFHTSEEARAVARGIAERSAGAPISLAWNRITLDRYIKHKMSPTRGARGLALVHVAMHDAQALALEAGREPRLAISAAAAGVLGYLFTSEERAFERIVEELVVLHAPMARSAEATEAALALGQAVADRVIARAQSDGAQYGWNGSRLEWRGEGRYYGPGTWEPTPPYHYFPPNEPFAPRWTPWVLPRADAVRPVPPAFGSPRYMRDLREVVEVAAALSDADRAIAKFWVDGHGSVTPPGHWNQIASDAARDAGLDEPATLALLRDLNLALADAFIATWECKYHYWTARPITAARRLLGITLVPAILTPPFPSYVSGHAAFSGAAAEVLSAHFPHRADEFRAMAAEAAHSRLLGGIHFRFDNEDGLTLGRDVAQLVLQRFGPAPDAPLPHLSESPP